KQLVQFSEQALQSGAAALAARTTIIVDVPMVQVGIVPRVQTTFANPVYCSMDALTRPQKEKTKAAWGIETLAKRYPEGIFVIGEAQTALESVVKLIETDEIRPALVVGTPAGFLDAEVIKARLQDSLTPNITISGRKGSAVVAAAMINGLIDLAWKAYGENLGAN
ncbi:MAG: precorrin-8X methylmutase, partial [Cyanobacteria bacterium P01_D01_bin.44]